MVGLVLKEVAAKLETTLKVKTQMDMDGKRIRDNTALQGTEILRIRCVGLCRHTNRIDYRNRFDRPWQSNVDFGPGG